MKFHPDDQAEIDRLHAEFIASDEPNNEQVMAFQDASYALGLKRGQTREAALQQRLNEADQRIDELESLINTPHTDEWFEGVRLEAAHQIERWGSEHDEGKQPSDWFWLLGFLGGKALAAAAAGNIEKAKHHTISSGAALLNWFRAISGDSTSMRPGIQLTKDSPEVGS